MKIISLTQGKVALVDDDAPAWIFETKWCVSQKRGIFYAVRGLVGEDGRHKTQYLHSIILKAAPGQQVDHINGNSLDDRRENLRFVTDAENRRAFNRPRASSISGFRGIYWNNRFHKWEAQIKHAGKSIYIGLYDILIDAVLDRDAKARQLGWPDSGLNFPLYEYSGT